MHSLYFVITPHADGVSSREVLNEVERILDNEDFVFSDKLWSGGKCDWYGIGGRWSGLLSELTWAKMAVAEILKLEQKNDVQINGVFYGDSDKSLKQKEIQEQAEQIWNKHKPKEYLLTTYYRNQFENTPQDDDAMIITPELWHKLKETYNDVEVYDSENHQEFTISSVTDDDLYIAKWITVVDYHF
jgi:hypothetical protein